MAVTACPLCHVRPVRGRVEVIAPAQVGFFGRSNACSDAIVAHIIHRFPSVADGADTLRGTRSRSSFCVLAAASDVQHSVSCAGLLSLINEQIRKDPKRGLVFKGSSPVAAAPTAVPSVESAKKKPKVEVAKGPFSSLANAGIEIKFKLSALSESSAGGEVLLASEVLTTKEAYERAFEVVHSSFGKLGNQDGGLRLLSEKQDRGYVLDELRRIMKTFTQGFGGWPFRKYEIRFFTVLCTLPGSPAQDKHTDHTDPRVWSLIVCIGLCIREVRFIVDGKEFALMLSPGDALLFRGTVCHFGGPSGTNCRCGTDRPCRAESGKELSVSVACVELALHCYVVVDIAGRPPFDWAKLGKAVFGCPHG